MPEKQAFAIIAAISLFIGGILFLFFFGVPSTQSFDIDKNPPSVEMAPVTTENSTMIIFIEGEDRLFYTTPLENQKVEIDPNTLKKVIQEHIEKMPDYDVSVQASDGVEYAIVRKYVEVIQASGASRMRLITN